MNRTKFPRPLVNLVRGANKILIPPAVDEVSRIYAPALVFLVGTLSLAFLFPLAVIFQAEKLAALVALVFFFPLPALAYAYLCRFNYVDSRPALKLPPRKSGMR